jgi:hypothetical protein
VIGPPKPDPPPAAPHRPVLEVRREFLPIGSVASPWEQRPYTCTVWKYDGALHVSKVAVPHDYVLGLFTCYIDGRKVDLGAFDQALAAIKWSRADIERTIASPESFVS